MRNSNDLRPGRYISADDKEAARTCPCGAGTYQDATNHRIETCSTQTTCGKGSGSTS